jgi:hypothetical protein
MKNEAVIVSQQRISYDQMDLLLNCITPLQKNKHHKVEREGIIPNSFYKASIILMPKDR